LADTGGVFGGALYDIIFMVFTELTEELIIHRSESKKTKRSYLEVHIINPADKPNYLDRG